MHVALVTDGWISENTLYCNRYHARFTPGACASHHKKFGDLRCAGCAGLEDQERELPRLEPVIFFTEPKVYTADLEQILEKCDGDPREPEPEELDLELVEDELNDFHLELLGILDDDFEEPKMEPAQRPEKANPRRFAVYMGRCPRCSGYVVNAPEIYEGKRDDDCHRCFTCGYRIGPAYEWNRLRRA